MKVHFVFAPPLIKSRLAPLWQAALPPLGILYLASYLRKEWPEIETKATDGLAVGMEQTLAEILAFGPDVLCVSYYTGSALGAYRLMRAVSAEQRPALVVAGGPHATALPAEALTQSPVDIVVRGEGELALARLVGELLQHGRLDADMLSTIPGIAFRVDERVVITDPGTNVADLDKLPFPAWDLLPMSSYRGYHLCQQSPESPVLFSRGCPHDCVFCPNEHWNLSRPKVRHRSPRNIGDELEELARQHGVREFNNLSDELNNHPQIAVDTCHEIARRKLGITWKTMLRSDNVSDALVRAMAESGCWMASLGIETGNPVTMRGIKKHFTHEDVERTARLCKRYGLKVQAYFMLYNAWEEDGQLCYEDTAASRNTIAYAEQLLSEGLLDYMGWSVATPYPGSELYAIALRRGLITDECVGRWDDWAQEALFVMKLPGVNPADQIRVTRQAQTLGARASFLRDGIRWADVPMMLRTALHTLRTEARLTLRHEG
jgi:radical SAM superfamily enzyme YgiQ (UPF0313 family)